MAPPAIYCDHNATTPTDPEVAEQMRLVMTEEFANPSSIHVFGQRAKSRLTDARARIARFLGAEPAEIVLTGGGSESDNLAIFGVMHAGGAQGRHFITCTTEHPAVVASAERLENEGFEVTWLGVDSNGQIEPDELRRTMRPGTALVSLMLANNETGVIAPIGELARIAHEGGALFHTDAVQAIGKIDIDLPALDVDLVSAASHKFYGPKGFGFLYVRSGVDLAPHIRGGHQEQGRRAGTEDVAAAYGTALALERCAADGEGKARVQRMTENFARRVVNEIEDVVWYGADGPRLPNTAMIGFGGIDGGSLAIALDLRGVAVSTGSACASGATEPSPVLQAMAADAHFARGAIRFSFGRLNVDGDDARVFAAVGTEVERLRALAPAS